MDDIKLEYNKKIDNLLEYINLTKDMDSIIRQNDNCELSLKINQLLKHRKKKAYDYNLIIITLYGIFESFIENIIMSYLGKLEKYVHDYNDLSPKIKENHILLSSELIKNVDKLSKYKDINKETIISNLYSCISNKPNYKINVEAFTHHTSNFRIDTIRTIFQSIGFENITAGIVKNHFLMDYFTNIEREEQFDIEAKQEESFFCILLDIVERRNEIAHGTESDDLISIDRLKDYIFYIQSLMNSIYEIIYSNLVLIIIENSKKEVLGKPIKVFTERHVIGINSNNILLKPNMKVYALNKSKNKGYIGKIISIQHKNNVLEQVGNDENIEIGIKLEATPIKDNYEYGILIEDFQ